MSAPSPANQNRSGETPVNARDDEPPPLPDESPELPSEVVSPAVETPEADVVEVVDAGAVVIVVVVDDPFGEVVVVVGEVVVVVDVVVVEVEVVVPEVAVNLTVTGRSGRFTPSVVSSAVKVTDSAVVSVTVNRAFPVSVVVPLTAATIELPPEGVSVTALPGTASPAPL
jgi:hypothetical protein